MNADLKRRSREKQKQFRYFLKNVSQSEFIKKLPVLHEEAFKKVNCLECAHCCKNHSPTFKKPDIKRISKYLGMKEGKFIDTYLYLDDENDYVLKSLPCPFLGNDNKCSIYEFRPSDCARYPYSNEDVFVKKIELTLTNSMVCPAVFHILEKVSSIK